MLPSAPRHLKDCAEPMLHIYSASTIARISLLDRKEIRPGEGAFARISSGNPLVVMHGDRFVLRISDAGTIGGGVVLDSKPSKRSRRQAVEELKTLSSGSLKDRAYLYVRRAGQSGVSIPDLSIMLTTEASIVNDAVGELVRSGDVIKANDILVSVETLKLLKEAVLSELKEFHAKEPVKEGVLAEDMRTRLDIPQKLMGIVMDGLVKDKVAVSERDVIRLISHKVSGGETKERIERVYIDAGLTPPILSELLEKMKIREKEALDLLHVLVKEGKLVKVKDLFFSKGVVDNLQARVVELLRTKGEMSPLDFKEMTGLSRKFAIPLLEYLDLQKITIRVGDVRKLRKG